MCGGYKGEFRDNVDPMLFLASPNKEGIEAMSKPYDIKRSCGVKDEEGFVAGEIQSEESDQVTMKMITNQTLTVKKDDTQQMNPPRLYQANNMADMTFLNEASVLDNLHQCYVHMRICTYSGLFCMTVNPFRWLPIYGAHVANTYKGKKHMEMLPHLFSISDNAYHDLLMDGENQSMLITRESGAGKTENTKKVTQYFANVRETGKQSSHKKGSPEDQIIQASPVQEAFRNAKTTRNNNSSCFGKFIRIHFGTTGKLARADIKSYLLEKYRVISQQAAKRGYHIFWRIFSKKKPELVEHLLLVPNPKEYHWISQGVTVVDNMDEGEELQITDDAFDMLDFSAMEISVYKMTGGITLFGNMKFKQKPRKEQAEEDTTEVADKVAHLKGLNSGELQKGVTRAQIKVGNEFAKGQNMEQCNNSTGVLGKAIYDKMFKWLVVRINKTLDTKMQRQFFMGGVDTAGFEIFEFNSFEQLLRINFTSENLQQFFNHHMFMLEQEYKHEDIKWTFIDFGLDLQACMELLEKPMGILSILEEQCVFPKAMDATFKAALYDNHLGKSSKFLKPKLGSECKGPEAHFKLIHYAGTVGYNIIGWLEKNKDTLNETVVGLFQKSSMGLLGVLFKEEEVPAGGKKQKRASSFMMVSNFYQLNKPMTTSHSTAPHFVQCIVPSECKQSGVVDAHLIMHQLACNGVLEGTHICRKGFPNRPQYPEFKRYQVLNPNMIPQGFVDNKKAWGSELLLGAINLNANEYKIGHTKVFFRVGILAKVEDVRDKHLAKIMTLLQCQLQGFVMRVKFKKMLECRLGPKVIQRNRCKFLQLHLWGWQKLYHKAKPLLNVARQKEEMKAKEEELRNAMAKTQELGNKVKDPEEKRATLSQEKKDLTIHLQAEQENLMDAKEHLTQMMKSKMELESQISDMQERLEEEEEGTAASLSASKRGASDLKQDLQGLETMLAKTEKEKQALDHRVRTLGDLSLHEDNIPKLQKEKRALEELCQEYQGSTEQVGNAHLPEAVLLSSALPLPRMEQNNKREAELPKLWHEVEEVTLQSEVTASTLRKKHTDSMVELTEHVENLQRVKSKLEKDKQVMKAEIDDFDASLETVQKSKMNAEAHIRKLEDSLAEASAKVAELERNQAEINIIRTHLQAENSELSHEYEESQSRLNQILRLKTSLTSQMDDYARDIAQWHSACLSRSTATVSLGLANTKRALDLLKERLEKQGGKSELQRLVSKLNNKVSTWRTKYETDVIQGTKELEETKRKLAARLQEAEEAAETAQTWSAFLEENKQRLQAEVEDLTIDLEKANAAAAALDEKQRVFEKMLAEWQQKCKELQVEVGSSQKDDAYMTESFNKTAFEESLEHLEPVKKKNKTLHKEIKELTDQLGEGGWSVHELQKLKKKLEIEKEELRVAPEEAQSSLEVEESKVIRIQLKLAQVKADIDQRIHQKEEFEATRKNYQRAIESLRQMEAEAKGRAEALLKKKMEMDLNEMEIQLDHANKNNSKFVKTLKRLQQQIKDLQVQMGEDAQQHKEPWEQYKLQDQHLSLLQTELEKVRSSLEGSKSSRELLEQEVAEITESNEIHIQNQSLLMVKHKLVSDVQCISNKHEELVSEFHAVDERAKKAMTTAYMAEKLWQQQNHMHLEKIKKNYEVTNKDLQAKMEEAEQMALKGGKCTIMKLEARIKELETELDGEQKGHMETVKMLHKNKHCLKELVFQMQEDHKTNQRMQELVEKLQNKLKVYKWQMEAKEQANQISAHRKTVHELDDAEERAGMAETTLNKLRTRHCVAGKDITSVEIIQLSKTGSSKTPSEE
ncbi:LOW QUALITY PROTEIN: uncharacterized protein MYH16 [Erethizon dorsatum]